MIVSLVRHAKASSRRSWSGADADRPLDATGRVQATTIADLFAGRPVKRVLSSPAQRCQQSVGQLAHQLGRSIELHPALAEGADPASALRLIAGLVAAGEDSVLCSHGDIIPEVIDRLAHDGVRIDGIRACAKGSTWDLEADQGVVVSARYLPLP